jgi:hypothetical protein
MYPSNETPTAVARFQEILEGEIALGEFDFQGALRGLPERNQSIQLQIFASLHRRRAKLRRARSGEFAARNSMSGEGAPVVITILKMAIV